MEQDYLKLFDKIFGTKLTKKIRLDMPLLKLIFNEFGETLYTPSKRYEELRHQKIKLTDKLEKTFSEEQQIMFNQYNEVENQISGDIEEQLFMFGYIIATELGKETQIDNE